MQTSSKPSEKVHLWPGCYFTFVAFCAGIFACFVLSFLGIYLWPANPTEEPPSVLPDKPWVECPVCQTDSLKRQIGELERDLSKAEIDHRACLEREKKCQEELASSKAMLSHAKTGHDACELKQREMEGEIVKGKECSENLTTCSNKQKQLVRECESEKSTLRQELESKLTKEREKCVEGHNAATFTIGKMKEDAEKAQQQLTTTTVELEKCLNKAPPDCSEEEAKLKEVEGKLDESERELYARATQIGELKKDNFKCEQDRSIFHIRMKEAEEEASQLRQEARGA